jgi:RNase P/RNase MRP subunit p29
MVVMERLLNTRGALIAAWSVVGVLVLGGVGFAVFLLVPAGSGADEGNATLRSVTVAVVATATVPTGRAAITGTVERVERQALVVKTANNESRRVVLRSNAHVGRLSTTTGTSDIKTGESVMVSIRRLDSGRLVGGSVRIQPADLPIVSPGGDARPSNTAGAVQFVPGTVVAVEPNQLRIRTASGEQTLDVSGSVRVTRFSPVSLVEVRPGERVAIDGEHLVDGSLAAFSVQVFDAQ